MSSQPPANLHALIASAGDMHSAHNESATPLERISTSLTPRPAPNMCADFRAGSRAADVVAAASAQGMPSPAHDRRVITQSLFNMR